MDALSRLAGRPPANLPSRSATQFQSGEMDMRLRGDLPDTLIGYVAPDAPKYWRATTLDEYDGTTWRAGGSQPPGRSFDAGSQGTYVASALADQPSPGTGTQREDHVELTGATAGFLLAPGHPTTVRPADGGQVLVAGAARCSWSAARPVRSGSRDGPVSYDVRSVVVPTAASVPGTSVTDRAGPGRRLAPAARRPSPSAPATSPVSITAGATTRGEQVALIEHYLSTTYPYRLDSPVPPPDQDAVDHFLFDARTGLLRAVRRGRGRPAAHARRTRPGRDRLRLPDGRERPRRAPRQAGPRVGRGVAAGFGLADLGLHPARRRDRVEHQQGRRRRCTA